MWRLPKNFCKHICLPFYNFRHKAIEQEIFALTKSIQLIALSAMPDDVLMTHKRCTVMKLAQKYIYDWDFQKLVPKVFELFERYPLAIEKTKIWLYYLVKEGRGMDKQQFVQFVINHAPYYQRDIMSIAQSLIEEGRQKGWQEATLEIARNMWARGAAFDFIKQVTKLSDDKILALMFISHR
jgi:predicted transposase/invertase (TIGR01784 family)